MSIKNSSTMMEGLQPNKHGVFASPAIRHMLTKLHQLPKAEMKHLVPELQRALAVKNIAANFVSSGNQDNLVQALRKLSNTTTSAGDFPPPSKKAKRQSSNQAETSVDSVLIASSTTVTCFTTLKRIESDKPEKCKH